MSKRKKLVFENGREFLGYGFGSDACVVSEVVFCTSMVGYQEIISTPAYKGKMILFTYPIIGSYGLSDEDYESGSLTASGIIVREYNDFPSNFRYTKTLAEAMEEGNIPGIYGVDTRELTQMLRHEGIIKAVLGDESLSEEEIAEMFLSYKGTPSIADVSSKKIWYSRTPNFRYNVAVVDCGVTNSIIQSLNSRGCNVIIVPYNTPEEDILALRPHGVLISDGPSYPKDLQTVVDLIKSLAGKVSILGIGLGFLAITKAFGGGISEKRVMHYGSNHPVRNLNTGKIEITAQNHSYTADEEQIKETDLRVTHRNLTDDSIEGIEAIIGGRKVSAVSYYPECTSDDTDTAYIYDDFIADISGLTTGKDDNNA